MVTKWEPEDNGNALEESQMQLHAVEDGNRIADALLVGGGGRGWVGDPGMPWSGGSRGGWDPAERYCQQCERKGLTPPRGGTNTLGLAVTPG